ncbi:hypothetical protein CBL_00119 [Carabus blaptoides fortunei]
MNDLYAIGSISLDHETNQWKYIKDDDLNDAQQRHLSTEVRINQKDIGRRSYCIPPAMIDISYEANKFFEASNMDAEAETKLGFEEKPAVPRARLLNAKRPGIFIGLGIGVQSCELDAAALLVLRMQQTMTTCNGINIVPQVSMHIALEGTGMYTMDSSPLYARAPDNGDISR